MFKTLHSALWIYSGVSYDSHNKEITDLFHVTAFCLRRYTRNSPALYANRSFTTESLSLIRSIHSTCLCYLLKLHFNIILSPKPRPSKWSFPIMYTHQNTACTFLYSIRATCPAHLILLDLKTRTFDEEYKSWSSSLRSFLHSPVTSHELGPNIFLSTLFSKNVSLCPSLNSRDQVSHSFQTTGKIIVLHTLIFKFMDSKLEDKRFCTEW